jgi:hypothetical protein
MVNRRSQAMDLSSGPTRRWLTATLGILTAAALLAAFLFRQYAQSDRMLASRQLDAQRLNLGRPSDLPLPSRLPLAEYETKLFDFLNQRGYVQLGWLPDKSVRDTGPFMNGRYYGTHPAVRVYYSPGVIRWLMNGRVGAIPDGEMIVKEQYAPPAIKHRGKTEQELWESLESWTVMVKDSSGSYDGWFWSNPAKGQCPVDNHQYPFAHPLSGFGHYCIRCHAAPQSPGTDPGSAANEFTFASLRNIAGFPGEPLQFRVDDSWRLEKPAAKPGSSTADNHPISHPSCARSIPVDRPIRNADPRFLAFFDSIGAGQLSEVSHLPPVTHDWVVSSRARPAEFLTSNQCMGCHAALVAPFGPTMLVPTGANADYGASARDVSPHGEWLWTPMGLAGRDPIFYAQLESELAALREEFRSDPAVAREWTETLTDTCLRCHAAMAKRQLDIDRPGAKFSLAHVLAAAGPSDHPGSGSSKYGALVRDGVGCMVCHRMQPRVQPDADRRPYLQYFLETSITGNFHIGTKGEIYGPFKDDDIAPYTMEHATGLKPKHGSFLKSSQLCGTCHTVSLPMIDRPLTSADSDRHSDDVLESETVPLFRKFRHHLEQVTYLEWLNSEYENEINPQNPKARSCQDCHMARGLKDEQHGLDIDPIQTRIAAIQDTTYPAAENLAPQDRLHVRIRKEGYRRHNFSGLNVFMLEMFNQFDDVLGVRKTDFMTGSSENLTHTVNDMVRTARNDVATLEMTARWHGSNRLEVQVLVKNKVGHRFPSGVGFRRAFLELSVVQMANAKGSSERILWSSGRTNELGVLLNADGKPLRTEFFARDPDTGEQLYQKHHEVITSPEQVQIYETLLRDAKREITTSFVRGCETLKDNRLLPRGWQPQGPGPALGGNFLKATHPDPATARHPRYADGSGSDEVIYRIQLPADVDPLDLEIRAKLYYQAIPPYYLRSLFTTAPDGPATRRLHYICSRVNLKGTPIEDWKLLIAAAACNVKRR